MSNTTDPRLWLRKTLSNTPSDLTPVYRSRIKMIAVGLGSAPYISKATGELEDGLESVPYVLTHDDRIFSFNRETDEWDELPPIPE